MDQAVKDREADRVEKFRKFRDALTHVHDEEKRAAYLEFQENMKLADEYLTETSASGIVDTFPELAFVGFPNSDLIFYRRGIFAVLMGGTPDHGAVGLIKLIDLLRLTKLEGEPEIR